MISGCSQNFEVMLWQNVSEIDEVVAVGSCDEIYATLVSGKREDVYSVDGESCVLIPFGVLTVDILNCDDKNLIKDLYFVLFVGIDKFEGVFEKNPYNDTFVFDLGCIVDGKSNVSLEVINNNKLVSLKLKFIQDEWSVRCNDCMSILIDSYQETLREWCVDEGFLGEIYIKVIDEWDRYGSEYYFYVLAVSRDGSKISMIISPYSGKVLAQNSNKS